MSKIKSLDKQVEDLAKKWYKKSLKPEYVGCFMLEFEEDEDLRKDVIEQYLESHPNIKKQYEEKKKIWFRAKMIVATTGVVAATIIGGTTYTDAKQQTNKNAIEQETEFEDDFVLAEQEKQEENEHKKFFEDIREISNKKDIESYITNYTKQIIVDKYNKEHPDNPITVDRLETLILEETVLKKTDRLGNHTYERVSQNSEGKDLVKIGNIYDFRIDGKTVAVFDTNGDILPDKNVEKQDMSFKEAVELVKESEKLKDIYKYPSNDNEKDEAEQKYAKILEEYEGQKDIDIAKSSQERE